MVAGSLSVLVGDAAPVTSMVAGSLSVFVLGFDRPVTSMVAGSLSVLVGMLPPSPRWWRGCSGKTRYMGFVALLA